MVTAGVYLIARAHPFFDASGDALQVVAWVGVLTALFAGGAALMQPDIKRVLAYSTISQLGYMFLALGVKAYTDAVFMVLMHAFFKGCLFLGAGSVIHGNAENQDIRIMGRFKPLPPVHRHRDDDRVAGDRGRSTVRGLLGQGRDPRVGLHRRRLRGLGARAARGDLHRALHDAPHPARLLRQRALPRRRRPRRGGERGARGVGRLRRRHGRARTPSTRPTCPKRSATTPTSCPPSTTRRRRRARRGSTGTTRTSHR